MASIESSTPDDSSYGLSSLLQKAFDVQEGSVGSHLHRLLRAARLHLGMEVAFISEFSGGMRVFRYIDEAMGVDVIAEGKGDPLDESYCQKVVDGHLPELIHNAQESEEACAIAATGQLGIGAHLSTPIHLQDGSVFGTFCSFSFRANHALNDRDRMLMHVFAEIAGELIEQDVQRARGEEARRCRIQELLNSDDLYMEWQPIVDINSSSIIGVEALARFPDAEYQGPDEWFEAASRAGLSNQLEARAVALGLTLLDLLEPQQYIACNASAEAIISGAVTSELERVPLDRVVLEITEHDVVDDYHALSKALMPLREKGLRLAVDDAGAGYASLKHIVRLRPDLIKLDMSLTRSVDCDLAKRSLIFCLKKFSDEIGAHLIAEGVETRAELDALKEIGVQSGQGFGLHRPVDRMALARLLERQP